MRSMRSVLPVGFTLVLGVLYIVPLLWIILTTFKSNSQVLQAPNSVIFTPTLDALQGILSAAADSIVISLIVSSIVTVVVLALAVPAAYALARRVSATWVTVGAIALGAFLVLQMVPQPMAVIPIYGILANWGLVNEIAGLVLADTALFLPFAILLLRPFVLAIPTELYEAAQIDGASQFRSFRSIVIPLLPNGIATVASLLFIITWGEFIYATTLLDPSSMPVSGLLAQQVSMYGINWNQMMGLALLTSLPLLVVFLIAKRYLVEGLSVGAVK
ncbi:carbohydrate ABC transporter permease [Ruania alba]|uniref:Multiple sugar transport system permease protein n=1 Tax=Ruania alba TaxID=648782 RepID=A0A1H5H082_9MICO|nr:carbohydrate ABC transporter permease [Ruania alba]SEE21141.1 multiple sugar transport system permease protein [Ruania alba]